MAPRWAMPNSCMRWGRADPMRGAILPLALLLTACATTPPPAPLSASQKAQLAQIEKAYAGGVITRDQYEAQKKKILTPK